MNIEQQKKLYTPDEWIIIYTPIRLGLQHKPSWRIVDNFNCKGDYKLIHKKHTHILDKYLDGYGIYFAVIGSSKLIKAMDFITNYCEGYTYYVTPKSLKNCYCKASELHYNKFVEYGYTPSNSIESSLHEYKYLIHHYQGTKELNLVSQSIIDELDNYTEVEYNEQIQKWVYCPKETKDIHNTSVSATNEVINNFKEYGFTADFAGKIEWIDDEGVLVGYVIQHGKKLNQQWDKDGISMCQNNSELTPIVSVYPIFKKNNFGVYRYEESGFITMVMNEDTERIGASIKEPSNTEDILYNAERGLYHGQPVWVVHANGSRTIDFVVINSVNFVTHLYRHNQMKTIEPISLETLKTLPFIWEQYKTFIKEN